jgi:hypothetical protein
MSKVDELEAAFKSKASFRNTSELLFTREMALEIIEVCAKKLIARVCQTVLTLSALFSIMAPEF